MIIMGFNFGGVGALHIVCPILLGLDPDESYLNGFLSDFMTEFLLISSRISSKSIFLPSKDPISLIGLAN